MVPTWLHFPSQNPSKSSRKSIPRCIEFLIDFGIDFFTIFVQFGRPTWGHVGHIFLQNGGVLWHAALFFVGSMLFFDFLARTPWGTPSDRAPKPMGYPSWARFSGPCGLGFQRFCGPFCKFCGSFLASLLALFSCSFSTFPAGTRWAGGVTRSAKNYG